jgi:hypothetical protein
MKLSRKKKKALKKARTGSQMKLSRKKKKALRKLPTVKRLDWLFKTVFGPEIRETNEKINRGEEIINRLIKFKYPEAGQ